MKYPSDLTDEQWALLEPVCPRFRIGDEVVSTISVVAQFGSPLDVTLDELRIELIYPADDRAEAFLRQAAALPME
jgi:hypothetical protein